MPTKRTYQRKNTTKSQPSQPVQREYDVRYVPDFVLGQIAGAKNGKSGRPELFSIRTYKVQTKDEGVKVGSYLVFGGVPPKALHEKLEDLGFKVRRRPAAWVDKQGNTHEVGQNDRECYAVYYNTEPVITQEQAAYIGELYAKTTEFVTKNGRSFLLADWANVDKNWGGADNWLQICTVAEEENSPATSTGGTTGVDLSDLNDMF